MTPIFPEMRQNLIAYIRGLSDIEYQWHCWVRNECPEGVAFDNLDQSIHFLFDDSQLADDAEGMIGYVLRDKTEAAVVSEVCRRLDDLLDRYGTQLSDEEYISKPEWTNVLESASRAHALLVQNDLVASPEA